VKSRLLALALLAGMAAVPEPPGFRLNEYNAPVPDSLRGATVLHGDALPAFIATAHPVLIDVLPAPRRPDGMAAGMPWLPLPHQNIPGSVWLPDARLAALTARDFAKPLVFYCRASCWMSWNAAKRAVSLGYTRVIWYPDGVEGWQQTGRKLTPANPPETPPPAK
jgi:rhodanese-related sulfurtransferase